MIDDLIRRAVSSALDELRPQIAAAVERRLAAELAGTSAYFPKPRVSDAQILGRFNGRNVDDVARALGVSRRTVYRALKRARQHE